MSKQKLDSLGIGAFCESMAMMLRSGIQTDEAVSLLRAEQGGGVLEQALAGMQSALEQGQTLAQAMTDTGVFPAYALAMVKAGEDAGRLESVLFRLSGYYARQKVMGDKLRGAVIYPASMLVLIIAVEAVMIAKILPAFTDVYDSLTGSLAASNYHYIRWSYGLCWAALAVMIVLVLALGIGLLLWNGKHRGAVEKLLYRLPAPAAILESMGLFRFTAALSMFLASGSMQDEAVIDSIPMTACKPVEEKLHACVREMEEGHSISQAACDTGLFAPVYGRMLLAGERSGELEDVLDHLNTLLQERAASLVDRLVGFIDPLLSGVLMLVVAFSLLSVMLPLIGMMNGIG